MTIDITTINPGTDELTQLADLVQADAVKTLVKKAFTDNVITTVMDLATLPKDSIGDLEHK